MVTKRGQDLIIKMATSAEVLRLYRRILRHSNNLIYTNKEFYKREVRREFEKGRNDKDIAFQIEVQDIVTLLCKYNCIFIFIEIASFFKEQFWWNYMTNIFFMNSHPKQILEWCRNGSKHFLLSSLFSKAARCLA